MDGLRGIVNLLSKLFWPPFPTGLVPVGPFPAGLVPVGPFPAGLVRVGPFPDGLVPVGWFPFLVVRVFLLLVTPFPGEPEAFGCVGCGGGPGGPLVVIGGWDWIEVEVGGPGGVCWLGFGPGGEFGRVVWGVDGGGPGGVCCPGGGPGGVCCLGSGPGGVWGMDGGGPVGDWVPSCRNREFGGVFRSCDCVIGVGPGVEPGGVWGEGGPKRVVCVVKGGPGGSSVPPSRTGVDCKTKII